MRKSEVSDDCTIIHLRGFILAHQILLTFHMFFQRYTVLVGSESVALLFGENLMESSDILKGESKFNQVEASTNEQTEFKVENDIVEPTNEMAIQLRHNFISFILRYTCNVFTHLIEDLVALHVVFLILF